MSVAYKETVKNEKFGYKEIVRQYANGDIEELLTEYDQRQRRDKIINRTVKHPDGSEEAFNQWNKLEHRILSDGTALGYNNGILHTKIFPDGSKQNFHDNGNVSFYKNSDNTLLIHYNEDGKIILKEDYQQKHFVAYDESGEIKYEFSPQKVYVNLKYIKPFKLGMKDRNRGNHWVENTALNPHKKAVLFFGGNGTHNASSANGYLNQVIDIFGLSDEQIGNIQLVSCYRQNYSDIITHYMQQLNDDFDYDKFKLQTYKQEILLKLMPFMAQKNGNNAWERIPPAQLYANFRNIMLMSHCYGSKDLCKVADILKQTMSKLGYSKDIQKIVCITNNTQREFNDHTGFTVFHRYSVFDGQDRKQYNEEYSTDYPVFLKQYLPFKQKRNAKAAFVKLNKNELLMVFSKVLKYHSGKDEHSAAFWTRDGKILTSVGKMQADVIKCVGQYWLNHNLPLNDAAEYMKRCVNNLKLRQKISAAFIAGYKLQRRKISPLYNPAIIAAAYQEYRHGLMSQNEHGAWKLLSDKAKTSEPISNPCGLYIDFYKEFAR